MRLSLPIALMKSGAIFSLLGVSFLFFQNCSQLTTGFQTSASAGTSYCVGRESESVCQSSTSIPACLFNGQTVAEGASVTAYLTSVGSTCVSQLRTCKGGALSGSYDYASCNSQPNAAAACLFNGATIAHGSNVTAYLNSSGICTTQTRSCQNGVLSGSYNYASCTPTAPASCLFNGQTLAHGQSVTAYSVSSVPAGQSCQAQVRTCYNGALSGVGEFASCEKQGPASCQFDGRTIASGGSVVAYAASRVSSGSTCQPQTRTCSNGTLSGTATFASCTVDQSASCLINGTTVVSGSAINLYTSSSVPAGETCKVQLRECNNGVLSGDATFSSCFVQSRELLARPGFHSYYFAPKIIREVSNAGVETFSVDTNLFGDDSGFSVPAAPSPGVWDFSPLLATINQVLAERPTARFIIRPYAGVPDWWKNFVPEELDAYEDGCVLVNTKRNSNGECVLSNGQAPTSTQQVRHVSRGSRVAMTHWKVGLQALKNSLPPNILKQVDGITLTGLSSQEWISWDANFPALSHVRPMAYGTSHRQQYRTWHTERYGTSVDVPSEADFQFANFNNPSRSAFFDLAYSANVVHYYQFINELTAKTILELARETKTLFPTVKVGAIYGYMNEMGGDPSFGHGGLQHLLASPDIDFINPMPSYQGRNIEGMGADFERQPITSLALNGKEILNDLDQMTHVSKQNYEVNCQAYRSSGNSHLLEVYRTQCNSGDPESMYVLQLSQGGFKVNPLNNSIIEMSVNDTITNLRRFLGFSIARNIKFSFLSLHNETTAGAEKSYLSDPDLLSYVVPQIIETKFASSTRNLASVAEILVISDEDSNNFVRQWPILPNFADRGLDQGGINYHALATSRIGLNKIGAPYDHILLSDLQKIDVTPYKLVLFLNAWSIDSNMRDLILQKLKKNGRTIVWNYATGVLKDGVKDLNNTASLIGMNMAAGASIKNPSVAINAAIYPLFSQSFTVAPNYPADCCDFIYTADPAASTLGYYVGTSATSMAIRDFGNWKSLWTATATLPGEVWRDIARSAGVHIYNNMSEPFYLNQSYVTITANSTGPRTLNLKTPAKIYEAVGNTVLSSKTSRYSFDAVYGGVYIFRLEQ